MLDAFSTKDYTGTNFFATGKKHFPSAKATFSNLLTDQLFAASFRTARQTLKTQKITFPDGSVRQLNLGRNLTLIVSPANESTAREILTAERNAAGATTRGTLDLRTAHGGLLTMKIVNGATGPTVQAQANVLAAHNSGSTPAAASVTARTSSPGVKSNGTRSVPTRWCHAYARAPDRSASPRSNSVNASVLNSFSGSRCA